MAVRTDESGSPIWDESSGLITDEGGAPAVTATALVTPPPPAAPPIPAPRPSTVQAYLDLLPPLHAGRPRFLATLAALLQPAVDLQNLLLGLPAAFDLDLAIGTQLDAVGRWAGVSRTVRVPLPNFFFTWGNPALGWGTGRWFNPYDDTSSLVVLDDPTFRSLIRARIAANHWDGTLAGMQLAYATIFPDQATRIFVVDGQDMTWTLNVAGQPLDPLMMALLTSNALPLRPAGMSLHAVNVTSLPGAPLFGFGLNNDEVAGWGVGAWAVAG